jgi:ABC-type multidrug transport system fused ATPase/permease subunit
MGNKGSRLPSLPNVVQPAGGVSAVAAPMDAVTQCRVKNVELSQLQNDVVKKQAEIDTCDPAEANRRRTTAKLQEFETYITGQNKQIDELQKSIMNTLSNINSVFVSSTPSRSYIEKLTEESNTLQKAKVDYEQAERTQRRNFLDNDPQSGVSGILGIRTSDDKVLLAFWITYGIAIVAAIMLVFSLYGANFTMAQKYQIGGVVIALAYGIAYYAITTYG